MNQYLGQILLFPYNFSPEGWVRCEGQSLSIEQNAPLFSLLGTTFGGDGQTNFVLPDLRGKEPLPDMHYCIAMSGAYPNRS